ncbi:MAG: BON domain-containing protein [Chiayiivirga sp.]|jgi:osmotically-inducible protein OsmY|uniref:BON domain-containing protein n=1 Tax=Denitratimonas tolerans TaxID=1338420 RepID=A0AAW9R432_9GAMM|nr:BON domain-containing protein [Xanthomonadaceae bacterium]MDX9764741.1 BON domain-containing protein [Chiayiivirga sp.]MEB2315119.1 BON domain-containing protein [Xanthomonadaceae bacterium]HRO87592.1 BON domain-containing protein [Chiayiivirga sp.]HRQ36018.1 BON domain-containing protein [Chiayiivirga sp.]
MNLQRTLLIAALSAPLLALATGCSVARKQETVGEYIDGAAITTEVKAKLASDAETSALNIGVKTIDAGVVQLSGFAKSQREKTRAGELARSVKGVRTVHNDLIIRP